MTTILRAALPSDDEDLKLPSHLTADLIRKLRKFAYKIAAGSGSGPVRFDAGRAISSVELKRGRCFRTISTDNPGEVDIFPTIKKELRWGVRQLVPINRIFWSKCQRIARPAVISMLIVDSSRSARQYLAALGEVLVSLFEKYFDNKSKVGMIVIQDGQARIMFPPTKNRLRVFGEMGRLSSGGYTPLSEAMRIAGTELNRQKRADASLKPFVILVSDCYPEPLPDDTSEPYESAPYCKARLNADFFERQRIPVVVIDPSEPSRHIAESMPGRKLARYIVRKTGGIFISLPASKLKRTVVTPKMIKDSLKEKQAAELSKILNGLFDTGRIQSLHGSSV